MESGLSSGTVIFPDRFAGIKSPPGTLIARHIVQHFMEIIPGVHQVDGVNGNCYVIANKRLVIIDAGIPGSGKTILAYIRNTLHREPS